MADEEGKSQPAGENEEAARPEEPPSEEPPSEEPPSEEPPSKEPPSKEPPFEEPLSSVETPEVQPGESDAGLEPSPPGDIPRDESIPVAASSGDFGMKDEALIRELKAAEEHASNTAALVEVLKGAIAELSKKENLTEEDASMLQLKQNELMKKLAEFEQVTKHIQNLVGLQQISSSLLGPPLQCREFPLMDPCQALKELRTPNLPKVIICGNESTNQIPKIIVCDPIENSDSKNPIYQQIPGGPLTISTTGEPHPVNPYTELPVSPRQTPRTGFIPQGPVQQNVPFGMAPPGQPGQQFAGTMPPPIRQIPGLMGQPPPMMSVPQTVMGRQMEMMTAQQGWSAGNMIGQQKMMPPSFAGVLGGMGPYEPYKPGPQDFNQRPPHEVKKGLSDASLEEMKKQLATLQEQMKKLTAENEELKTKLTAEGVSPRKCQNVKEMDPQLLSNLSGRGKRNTDSLSTGITKKMKQQTFLISDMASEDVNRLLEEVSSVESDTNFSLIYI